MFQLFPQFGGLNSKIKSQLKNYKDEIELDLHEVEFGYVTVLHMKWMVNPPCCVKVIVCACVCVLSVLLHFA